MSRHDFDLPGGASVTCGFDPPYETFFAILYAPDAPGDGVVKGVGYHPDEQAVAPGPEYGPYPVRTIKELVGYLDDAWNVELPDDVYRKLSEYR